MTKKKQTPDETGGTDVLDPEDFVVPPVTPVDASTPEDDEDEKDAPKRRPWYSGFCGPGPCRDEHTKCRHVCVNGVRASIPFVVCACPCHADTPLPDMTAVIAAHTAANKNK